MSNLAAKANEHWQDQYRTAKETEQAQWLNRFVNRINTFKPGTEELAELEWLINNRKKIKILKQVIELINF